MLFSRKAQTSPSRILRLVSRQGWREDEALRITPRPCVPTNPGARRLVMRRDGIEELSLTPMRWGLRGEVDAAFAIHHPLTSVRTEVIASDPEWRRMLNIRRCVVPAEQFYEWKRVEDVKTREYCIRLRSGKPMMMAGLWNRSPGHGETFAYINCTSNALMSRVHDRMPVLLDPADLPAWFNPDTTLDALLSMLRPARADEIELTPANRPPAQADARQGWLFERIAA